MGWDNGYKISKDNDVHNINCAKIYTCTLVSNGTTCMYHVTIKILMVIILILQLISTKGLFGIHVNKNATNCPYSAKFSKAIVISKM
uniref:Uncharacterized protein n=1 Tax=Amphimedon queenslandica TaxID=400682 RepID=A0A1X7U943_AMPQE